MDSKTTLAGVRTALKMSVNILERLEAGIDDWKVGCKCSSVEKLLFVKKILKVFLDSFDNKDIVIQVSEEFVLEVVCLKNDKVNQEEYRNLVVSANDKQCDSFQDISESPYTDNSSSSSASNNEEDKDDYEKACKSIDDCISMFQRNL